MPFSENELESFLFSFITAGVSASFTKTLIAPFDRVKLILQTQDSVLQILTKERPAYKGIIDCFLRLPKEQGILSFWRGNVTSVVRHFSTQALSFSINDFFKHRFYRTFGTDRPEKLILVKFLAGALAGSLTTGILFPLEVCQTRVTVDIGTGINYLKTNQPRVQREFSGAINCIGKIAKSEGLPGLYRGFLVAFVGAALYKGLYFSLFDISKRLWAREHAHSHHEIDKPPFPVEVLLAQGATWTAATCSYPFDTVSRRLMMEAGRPKELQLFSSSLGAFKVMYHKEGGVRAFYKGIWANYLGGLSGALILVFYDEILHYVKKTKTPE